MLDTSSVRSGMEVSTGPDATGAPYVRIMPLLTELG